MIALLVPEIEGGPLSVTEEKKEQKKDWSWSILVVGFASPFNDRCKNLVHYNYMATVR